MRHSLASMQRQRRVQCVFDREGLRSYFGEVRGVCCSERLSGQQRLRGRGTGKLQKGIPFKALELSTPC